MHPTMVDIRDKSLAPTVYTSIITHRNYYGIIY